MLENFSDRFGLAKESIDIKFEKFLNYCLLNEDYYDTFEFDTVSTGKCIGIDGLAIAIGGVIVNSLEMTETLTKAQFDVEFVFIQAKTSRKFNLGDFLKFISTIKVFFGKDDNAIPEELKLSYAIKNKIYSNAAKLRSLPRLKIYYGYTGNFNINETGLKPQIENEIKQLKDIQYTFSDVSYNIYDGDSIENLYREAHNEIQYKIPFQRHIALPPINGVKSTYIGVIKCIDFVSLITKSNGDINKGLFVGNVRDFLGARNPVNSEIEKTLNSPNEKERFAILNNGITIVAKKVTPSGDTFELSQFQIVNGCQTSHVLFNNSDLISDDMYLSVKLIETSDIDVSGSIIATTNSQSQVTKEALATIRPYHRKLEDFFTAMRRDSGYEYYYERRPHQYDDQQEITQKQIVSAPGIIKSFISVVLEEPHQVHYYYGQLLKEYNTNEASELFSEDDHPGLYFLSHHIVSKTKEKVDNDRELKNWLFHLSLLIKKQLANNLQKRKGINDKYFLEILSHIDMEFDSAYLTAVKNIKNLMFHLTPNENRFKKSTEKLIENLMKDKNSTPIAAVTHHNETQRSTANVRKFDDGRYIGIVSDIAQNGQNCVVTYSSTNFSPSIHQDSQGKLSVGTKVSFYIKNGTAIDAQPLY